MKALITIQVTEKEAIQIGSQRWSEKYWKRVYLFLGIGLVGAVLIMIALIGFRCQLPLFYLSLSVTPSSAS